MEEKRETEAIAPLGIIRSGEMSIDFGQALVTRAGEVVHVEPQVLAVLRYLIENRDRVISKAELFDNVWGDRFVGESALTSRIKSIRSAFGDDGKKQAVIRTVHGMGYQFVAPLDPSMPGATPRQESAPRKGCYGLRASADSRPWARNRAARAVMMP